ncbi:MAG: peptidoglycan DD-metalloendopeptidase family protein [Nitrospinota bacterium]
MVLPAAFSAEVALSERALLRQQVLLREANSVGRGEGGLGPGDELWKLCREFESIFVYQLLQAMRRSLPKDGLFSGGRIEELYQPMLDEELARSVSLGRGLGLGEILYGQFTRPQERGGAQSPRAPEPGGVDSPKAPEPTRSHNLSPPQPAEEKGEEEPFATPAEGFLSSSFGLRSDPITGHSRKHQGVDIAAGMGAPVTASRAGRVIFSGERGGYGKLVILDHGGGYTTYYGHNSELLVEEGQWVEALEPLALSGRSGRATGPHVHFEVRHMGRPVDPRPLIDRHI